MQLQTDGELALAERSQLAAHLHECGECRRVQQQLTAMSAAFGELSAASGGENRPLHIRPAMARPWRAPLAAAAAIVLLATAWLIIRQPLPAHTVQIARQTPAQHDDAPTAVRAQPAAAVTLATPTPAPAVRVRFSPDSNVLAVPIATRNPNITILRLYPKLQLARSSQAPGEQGS